MSITTVGIEKGYYGTYKIDKKGNSIFNKVGREIKLNAIKKNIDTNEVFLTLAYEYLGNTQSIEVSREILYDMSLIGKDVAKGIDVSKKTADIAVDSIRLQEDAFTKKGYIVKNIFEKLGWTKLKTSDGAKACFRSYYLIGDTGAYTGNYKITPMGIFDEWRKMIIDDILGDTTFELILIAALSSVIIPIVSPFNDPGNPIMHLYGISGCGKSTGLVLAASIGGEPFEGDKIITTPDGSQKALHSLYRSWGGTVNALVGSCAGNKGYPILLNELGKCQASDMSSMVYNFSEGTDKLRYSKDMKVTQSEGYLTSFISTGEHSLLDRCKDKSDGLRVRVLEIEMSKTPNGAERADRIKYTCKKHNGYAIPKMVEYILGSSGFKEIQELYKKNYNECLEIWTPSPSFERFISKFVAPYLTTVDVASKALDIPFNKAAIQNFLLDYDKKNGASRNSSLSSYDILLEEFNINRNKFVFDDNLPKTDCWGKITKENKKISDKKYIVERFLVRRGPVNDLLKKHGFKNPSSCIKEWKAAGLIDADKDRNTRSRKIHPASNNKEDVFVFNVFNDKSTPEVIHIYQKTNLLKEDV